MQGADLALYHAKIGGRNQIQFFDTAMTRDLVRKKQIEAELRAAIQRDELSIFFQPIVDLETAASAPSRRWCAGSTPRRASCARRVHPGGRGHRRDHHARQLDHRAGGQGRRRLARRRDHRGQPLAGADPRAGRALGILNALKEAGSTRAGSSSR
jgi:hypothetical protein